MQSILGHSSQSGVSTASLVLQARSILEGTRLDPEAPLEWNRHQFWICFLTLALLVEVAEAIHFGVAHAYLEMRETKEQEVRMTIV